MHEYKPWQEERIATSRIDGVVIRLNTNQGGRFPDLLRGCEPTHQIGMWTSNLQRPRGQFRYGNHGAFTEMRQLTFVPAGVEWVAQLQHSGPIRPAIFCDFDDAYFNEVVGVGFGYEPDRLVSCVTESGSIIPQALRILADEVQSPGFSHAMKVDALCRLMLVEFARQLETLKCEDSAPRKAKLASWQMRRIREYVETIEGQSITVRSIADLCGISTSHLSRVFKATTGTPLSSYIDAIRLERAKILLTDRNIPLKQISYILGFANPNAFSTSFRRALGVTPRQFRQQSSYYGTNHHNRCDCDIHDEN